MKGNKAVVGIFQYQDDTVKAIEAVKEADLDYRVFSPFRDHAIEDASMPNKSPVRIVTLTGAVLGLVFGFALAIMCSLDYPLRVSAKDVVSIPGFVVIGYECTILFGALATLFAVFHFCRLPDILRKVGYDSRFSVDRYGVVVGCNSDNTDQIKQKLLDSGAEEVDVRDGL